MTLPDEGFLDLPPQRLEYRMIGPRPDAAPTIVMLHEGLGSVSAWRDFPDQLAQAAGGRVLDPRLGSLAVQPAEQPALTTRELEVLQLIVNGRSNKEIATMLGVSSNTVAVHRANIMQAMGIHNTAELVVCAIRQGLVSIT